jgi:putative FmdB family regulatory protein
MPLYEYECESCGNRIERIQKYSDPPLQECPRCPGQLRKLISSPAIQFKGSGFYITDYARKGEAGSKDGRDGKDAKDAKDTKEAAGSTADTSGKEGTKEAPKASPKPATDTSAPTKPAAKE